MRKILEFKMVQNWVHMRQI